MVLGNKRIDSVVFSIYFYIVHKIVHWLTATVVEYSPNTKISLEHYFSAFGKNETFGSYSLWVETIVCLLNPANVNISVNIPFDHISRTVICQSTSRRH